jgi:hypothetical protein
MALAGPPPSDMAGASAVVPDVAHGALKKPLDPLKCAYVVKGKQRQCSRAPEAHTAYCGNHAHLAVGVDPSGGDGSGGGGVTDGRSARVPCPVDPSHTVRSCSAKCKVMIAVHCRSSWSHTHTYTTYPPTHMFLHSAQVRRGDLDKHVRKCEAVKREQRRHEESTARAAAPKPPYVECMEPNPSHEPLRRTHSQSKVPLVHCRWPPNG